MKKFIFLSSATACLALSNVNAVYAETLSPKLTGEVTVELQNDWAYSADDPDAEVNAFYATIEPYLTLSLTERLALEASLVFEPVQDTDPGDDTFLENEGGYVEELKLTYATDTYGFVLGKYNPSFGMAWDKAPGVYGVDFAEDYETAERIGLGGSCTIGSEEAGKHTFSVNSFFLDTTFLSDSKITSRGDTDKADGGSSNTQSLSSFSVTADSENMAGVKGLNTHVGYRNQAPGDADAGFDREQGYALGANYTFPISDSVEAMVLGEWVSLRNLDGDDDDIDYLTGSLGLTIHENWNVAVSYTKRDKDVTGGADENDHLFQVSGGYAFDNGISLDVGYLNTEEASEETDSLGALVAYTYSFE